MHIGDFKEDCLFCWKFGGRSSSSISWYDRLLVEYGMFGVVTSIGPLVEGYLLIITTSHYINSAWLLPSDLDQLQEIQLEIRQVLTRLYKPPVFFEHGPGSTISGGGACIDHAHIHACPTDVDLVSCVRNYHNLQPIRSLTDLVEFRASEHGYLMVEDQEGQIFVCALHERPPSQYIRRFLADELGKPDQWDYTIFPNYDLVAKTQKRLTPWPTMKREQ